MYFVRTVSEDMYMFWQIVIEDKDCLSGTSIARLMTFLRTEVPYCFVQVLELDGGDQYLLDDVRDRACIGVDDFINKIQEVVQVDWGTVCLVGEDGRLLQMMDCYQMAVESLRAGNVVVRYVDGFLFYIFTSNTQLSIALQSMYKCLSVIQVAPSEMEWPE